MKRITIYELCPRNYKKNGTLKKNAQSEMGITISNHLDGKDHSHEDTLYIASQIRRTLPNAHFESPYVFSHIRAHSADGKEYAIYEHVSLAGTELITSPVKLLEALTK